MKTMKVMLVVMVLMGCMFVQRAEAAEAWYTCDVERVGLSNDKLYVRMSEANQVFKWKWVVLDGNTGSQNQMLAIILTAISAGKQITVKIDPSLSYPSVKLLHLRNMD